MCLRAKCITQTTHFELPENARFRTTVHHSGRSRRGRTFLGAGFGLLNLFHGKLAYIVIGKLISTVRAGRRAMNCWGTTTKNGEINQHVQMEFANWIFLLKIKWNGWFAPGRARAFCVEDSGSRAGWAFFPVDLLDWLNYWWKMHATIGEYCSDGLRLGFSGPMFMVVENRDITGQSSRFEPGWAVGQTWRNDLKRALSI